MFYPSDPLDVKWLSLTSATLWAVCQFDASTESESSSLSTMFTIWFRRHLAGLFAFGVAEALVFQAASASAQAAALRGVGSTNVSARRSDDAIRSAVADELRRDRHVAFDDLRVGVRQGVVEIVGTVASLGAKDRADRLTRAVHGVRAVVSRVRVALGRRPDVEIARDVRQALRAAPALARAPIRVKVVEGVVEIDGYIDNWDEQQLAGTVARTIPGVRFCQNQLVARRSSKRLPARLEGDVRSRLDWDPLVQHDPVAVSVRGTQVSLRGKVGSGAEWRRACALAFVRGVTKVDCAQLVVDAVSRPNANIRARWPTDAEIAAAFKDIAAYWPSVSVANVNVAVSAGEVTLTGAAPTLSDSLAAEGMARCLVGVSNVNNRLQGPWGRSPGSAPPVQRRGVPRKR